MSQAIILFVLALAALLSLLLIVFAVYIYFKHERRIRKNNLVNNFDIKKYKNLRSDRSSNHSFVNGATSERFVNCKGTDCLS